MRANSRHVPRDVSAISLSKVCYVKTRYCDDMRRLGLPQNCDDNGDSKSFAVRRETFVSRKSDEQGDCE